MTALPTLFLMVTMATAPRAAASDSAALVQLLGTFLDGAGKPGAAVHERFWADDLIYTGSSGRRIGKADILADLRAAASPRPAGPETTYTAEDIRIHQYGDTAIVAFRLVGTTQAGGRTEVARYLNTGTFLRRGGEWRAVAWQATKAPRSEDETKAEVAAAQAAIDRAILTADAKALESLLDETFVWTHPTGEKGTRTELVADLTAGTLRFSKLETAAVSVSAYGDTAVARGESRRQRSAFPGSAPGGDAQPYTSFFTTTFVNKDGVWKAVALHTSRAR